MSKIVIKNLDNKIVSYNDKNLTILDAIHQSDTDWMHACGKKGRCTTCKMIVEEGAGNMSALSEVERNFRELGKLKEGQRLACQSYLMEGELEVRVAEENQLPHLQYS